MYPRRDLTRPGDVHRLHALGSTQLQSRDGYPLHTVLAQPKRLALLAFMAAEWGHAFHRRDLLLPLFWPEMDGERARAALRKAIHFLRQALGRDAVAGRGEDELAIAESALWCDVIAFERAVAEDRAEEALALYRGELLPGFALAGAPEFERWLEERRADLRRKAVAMAWRASEQAEARGDVDRALAAGRRAFELGPEEPALRRLLVLHDRAGDRPGAIRAFEEFRQRLHAEYELEPGADTAALAARIRAGDGARATPTRTLEPGPKPELPASPTPSRSPADAAPRPARRIGARARLVGAAAVILAAAVGVPLALRATRSHERPVLAVGTVRDFTGDSTSALGAAIPELLATTLARDAGTHVVSPARVYELLGRGGATTPEAAATAARKAGADVLLEGAVYALPEGGLRLDLRQIDLGRGSIRGSLTVRGGDAFALVERAAAALGTQDAGAAVAARGGAGRSLVAYRFYEEGLRALYRRGDAHVAFVHFTAALREDSTFAMAAYHAALARSGEFDSSLTYLAQARRLARHATDRERLLINAAWADALNEPARVAVAETLAVRYPRDPEGRLLYGRALLWAGDFPRAVVQLRQAVAADPPRAGDDSGACVACDAMYWLVGAYVQQDSLEAAERVARQYLARMPRSASALGTLANVLAFAGRHDEALAARAELARVSSTDRAFEVERGALGTRAGRLAEAEALLRRVAQQGTPDQRPNALWYLGINLRNQGRPREALAIARAYREERLRVGDTPFGEIALAVGVALFESGAHRAAAALFDSSAMAYRAPYSVASTARGKAWMLTHAATALAAAGDTAALHSLAARIQALGAQSAYGRDQRLHFHVRALLARRRGEDGAAERLFRQAIFSPTAGHTRTSLELGRVLIEQGRATEAVPVLRAALHGPLEASNYYVTHAELHELLGRAFDASGARDSARVHFRWVRDAWTRAEPPFRARRAEIVRRLAELGD